MRIYAIRGSLINVNDVRCQIGSNKCLDRKLCQTSQCLIGYPRGCCVSILQSCQQWRCGQWRSTGARCCKNTPREGHEVKCYKNALREGHDLRVILRRVAPQHAIKGLCALFSYFDPLGRQRILRLHVYAAALYHGPSATPAGSRLVSHGCASALKGATSEP